MPAATVRDIPELRRRLEEAGYKEIDFGDTYGLIRGIVVDGQVVRSALFDADPSNMDEQSRAAFEEAINSFTPDWWIERVLQRAPVGKTVPNATIRPSPLQ